MWLDEQTPDNGLRQVQKLAEGTHPHKEGRHRKIDRIPGISRTRSTYLSVYCLSSHALARKTSFSTPYRFSIVAARAASPFRPGSQQFRQLATAEEELERSSAAFYSSSAAAVTFFECETVLVGRTFSHPFPAKDQAFDRRGARAIFSSVLQ